MGAPKGHKRYGGRKKGTPNKTSLPLQEKAKELGVDPFEILLRFASGDWKKLGYEEGHHTICDRWGGTHHVFIITPEMRLRAASEAAQYLHPKRKAIEVTEEKPPVPRPLEDLTDEELDEL